MMTTMAMMVVVMMMMMMMMLMVMIMLLMKMMMMVMMMMTMMMMMMMMMIIMMMMNGDLYSTNQSVNTAHLENERVDKIHRKPWMELPIHGLYTVVKTSPSRKITLRDLV